MEAQRAIIYLVGFMGSGKTSVGKRLAELLRRQFVDLDQRIEAREGLSIPAIFEESGESHFRRVESRELLRVSQEESVVVALGGGTFCDPSNQEVVRRSGTSIWLDTPLDTLVPRCSSDESRPLFKDRRQMEALLAQRRPFYERADIHVSTGQLTVEEIAAHILSQLN